MLTLEQLENVYSRDKQRFVEITDREDALSQLNSKMSCCWGAGQKYGDSGWIQLCSPSRQTSKDVQVVFVCKKDLIL